MHTDAAIGPEIITATDAVIRAATHAERVVPMTLQDVFEAVHKLTDDDREAVAIVARLLESGRIRRDTEGVSATPPR